MHSVPFTAEIYEGLAETQGVVRFEDNVLIIEFETKDSIVGFVKSGMQELTVPVSELEEAVFKKNIFRAKILFRASRMKTFSALPNNKQGEVGLKVPKKYAKAAQDLVDSLNIAVMEAKIDRLDTGGRTQIE